MKMRHREGVGASTVDRRMNRPLDGRTFSSFEGLAFEVRRNHVLGAQAAFVGAHARCNEDSFRFRLIDAHVAKDADHALHGKDARAGGELFAQIVLRNHRSVLLCPASSSFLTSSTSRRYSNRSGGMSSLICIGILMSYSRKFLMPSAEGSPGTGCDTARR